VHDNVDSFRILAMKIVPNMDKLEKSVQASSAQYGDTAGVFLRSRLGRNT